MQVAEITIIALSPIAGIAFTRKVANLVKVVSHLKFPSLSSHAGPRPTYTDTKSNLLGQNRRFLNRRKCCVELGIVRIEGDRFPGGMPRRRCLRHLRLDHRRSLRKPFANGLGNADKLEGAVFADNFRFDNRSCPTSPHSSASRSWGTQAAMNNFNYRRWFERSVVDSNRSSSLSATASA